MAEWQTLILAPLSPDTMLSLQVRGPFTAEEYACLKQYLDLLVRRVDSSHTAPRGPDGAGSRE